MDTQKILLNFETFYQQHKKQIKTLEPGVFSFAFELEGFNNLDLNSIINNTGKFFFISKNNISYLALEDIYSITDSGQMRLELIDKKSMVFKNRNFNNFSDIGLNSAPLFFGGVKFNTDKSSTIWNDYNDLEWFIPELLIINNDLDNDSTFIINFLNNNSFERVKNTLERKLNFISSNRNNVHHSCSLEITPHNYIKAKEKKKWKLLVEDAKDKIESGDLEKVVLSRQLEFNLNCSPNYNYLISNLKERYPDCSTFLYKRKNSTFWGSSPERLAEFNDGKILIDILAGTAELKEDGSDEQTLFTAKNNLEHEIVLNNAINVLKKLSIQHNVDKKFETLHIGNIAHIQSLISGKLNTHGMFAILKDLYPTPAVCGFPKDDAYHFIKKEEEHCRGLYSGIIGWFNPNNQGGEFIVSIRSALQQNHKLYLFAGCGIVNDSNPDEEFAETKLKFSTLLSLFKIAGPVELQH